MRPMASNTECVCLFPVHGLCRAFNCKQWGWNVCACGSRKSTLASLPNAFQFAGHSSCRQNKWSSTWLFTCAIFLWSSQWTTEWTLVIFWTFEWDLLCKSSFISLVSNDLLFNFLPGVFWMSRWCNNLDLDKNQSTFPRLFDILPLRTLVSSPCKEELPFVAFFPTSLVLLIIICSN